MNKKERKETEKQRKGRLAAQRGKRYERKIINEFKEMGFKNIMSTREYSRYLDNKGVDIADPENEMPFYTQLKCTLVQPQLSKLFREFELTDKPLVIIWNKQIPNGEKQKSDGEYVTIPKSYFYQLIQRDTNKEKENEDSNNHSDSLSE